MAHFYNKNVNLVINAISLWLLYLVSNFKIYLPTMESTAEPVFFLLN